MLGLGMLSKYAAVLLIAGAGLYVLTRREQRHWLAHPGPYLALAIALCDLRAGGRVECPAPVGVVLLPEHARRRGLRRASGRTGSSRTSRARRWPSCPGSGRASSSSSSPGSGGGPRSPRGSSSPGCPCRPSCCSPAWPRGRARASTTSTGRRPATSSSSSRSERRCAAASRAGSRLYRGALAATAAATLIGITVLTSHIATGWLQDLPVLSRVLTGIEDPDLRMRGHDGPRARVSRSAGSWTGTTSSSSRTGGSAPARWTTG